MGGGSEKFSAEKRQLFESWMSGDHVLVHLDSSQPEVDVPQHLKGNPSLTLKLSYLFVGPTAHDEKEITTELRFQNSYYTCVIPWRTVWGFTSAEGEQKLWSEDIPSEVIAHMTKSTLREIGKRILGIGKETSVDSAEKAKEVSASEGVAAPKSPLLKAMKGKQKRTPNLRRIK